MQQQQQAFSNEFSTTKKLHEAVWNSQSKQQEECVCLCVCSPNSRPPAWVKAKNNHNNPQSVRIHISLFTASSSLSNLAALANGDSLLFCGVDERCDFNALIYTICTWIYDSLSVLEAIRVQATKQNLAQLGDKKQPTDI